MFFMLEIDPIAFQFGPFSLGKYTIGPIAFHWYGLMYLLGFIGAWWLGSYRAAKPGSNWTKTEVSDLIFYGAIGVIVGGRLGSVLFYNFGYYFQDLKHMFEIFFIWRGGMSFHGGMLGVAFAFWWFARASGKSFLTVADFLVPMVPIGLFTGRIGNFINQELWGKVTDLPWGVVFKGAGSAPRHPSQLYEAGLEGLALFGILWWYSSKPRPAGSVLALFLIGYGVFRFLVEFVRVPDEHLSYLAFNWLTMGQILSLPMVVGGIALFLWSRRTQA